MLGFIHDYWQSLSFWFHIHFFKRVKNSYPSNDKSIFTQPFRNDQDLTQDQF